MRSFIELSTIEESDAPITEVKAGLLALIADHEAISKKMANYIGELEQGNDYGTVDLLTDRIREHDKFAWLLRSCL